MYRAKIRLLTAAAAMLLSQTAYAADGQLVCTSEQRPISFSTTQGTIENIDVSPNGKQVVFDLLGDIYSISIRGGDAKALTRGTGWDSRPVWSPDGSLIAFISDRSGTDEVFVIKSDGQGFARQLTFGKELLTRGSEGVIGAAEWLPDSTGLMVNGVRVRLDGERYGKRSGEINENLFYSNGKVLYDFGASVHENVSSNPAYGIRKLDLVAGQWKSIGSSFQGPLSATYGAPLISRDGNWLVYKRTASLKDVSIPNLDRTFIDDQVDIVQAQDLRSGANRMLLPLRSSPSSHHNLLSGNGPSPMGRLATTPDSKYLVAGYGGGIVKIDLATGDLATLSMSAEVNQCLEPMARFHAKTDNGTSFRASNFAGTTLRPDGTQLVFSALRRLYIADPRTGQSTLLAGQKSGQFQPAYSPDGAWVAYVSWDETQGGHVWRVRSTGGTPERLTNKAGYYETPVWSPDGSAIAFIGSNDTFAKRSGFKVHVHPGTLRVLTVRDHSVRELPVQVRLGHAPAFSQDGRRIWYTGYSASSEPLQLNSVGTNGDQVRIESAGALFSDDAGEQVVPSPNGRLMAIVRYGDLHLLRCERDIDDQRFSVDGCVLSRVTRAGAHDVKWRADGAELEWSFAESHYHARTEALLKWLAAPNEHVTLPIVETRIAPLEMPQITALGDVVLTNARIITMRGNEVIENGAVNIVDGVIQWVGHALDMSPPAGATVIDLHGKTLMPGFIDAHAHLTDLPRDLLDANNGEALVYLAFGVTTAKDPSNGGDHAYTYSELIKTGDMVGPRLFGTEGLISRDQSISSFQDALGIAMRTRRLGGTFLKYHTGWDRTQRRWLIEAARQYGLGVAAHWPATNYSPGRLNLSTVIDGAGSAEHALSYGHRKYDDLVKLMALSGVSMNSSSVASEAGYPRRFWSDISLDPRMKAFYVGDEPRERALAKSEIDDKELPTLGWVEEINAGLIADIDNQGGNVAIGSHGDYDGIGFHLEMWAHVRGGMTPHAVLRAATLHGAQATGLEDELGSIEVGKVADLIVLTRNPLEDIRNTLSVEQVIQGGIMRDSTTLEETWPKKVPLPEWRAKSSQLGDSPRKSVH